jgi:hypothetical protein
VRGLAHDAQSHGTGAGMWQGACML